MFDLLYDIRNYIFPVTIVTAGNVLSIRDRRPTLDMFLSTAGLIAAVVIGFPFAFKPFDYLMPIGGLIAVAAFLVYRVLTRPFQQTYIFDLSQDTYWFTRQSILKKDVTQGSASQFCAVQVDRIETDESETYKATLLQKPGLLFGTDERQHLREDTPIFNSWDTEYRIANAIAKYLKIDNQGEVE